MPEPDEYGIVSQFEVERERRIAREKREHGDPYRVWQERKWWLEAAQEEQREMAKRGFSNNIGKVQL